MLAEANKLLLAEKPSGDTLWFCRVRTRQPASSESPVLARFFDDRRLLFIAGMASWPVLLAALVVSAWLGFPRLALSLATLISSVGFACCGLSTFDCEQPILPQAGRLLSCLGLWVVAVAYSLRLCAGVF